MMEGLGRLFDLSAMAAVQSLGGGNAVTGLRVSLKNAPAITVVVYKGAGTNTQDPVLTFKQATAASGGSSSNWPSTISYYYKKTGNGASGILTGSETWSKVTQTANYLVTLTGEATQQGLYAVTVFAGDPTIRTDPYLEVDVASTAAAQYIAMIAVLGDLEVQRAPANMASSQS